MFPATPSLPIDRPIVVPWASSRNRSTIANPCPMAASATFFWFSSLAWLSAISRTCALESFSFGSSSVFRAGKLTYAQTSFSASSFAAVPVGFMPSCLIASRSFFGV